MSHIETAQTALIKATAALTKIESHEASAPPLGQRAQFHDRACGQDDWRHRSADLAGSHEVIASFRKSNNQILIQL